MRVITSTVDGSAIHAHRASTWVIVAVQDVPYATSPLDVRILIVMLKARFDVSSARSVVKLALGPLGP